MAIRSLGSGQMTVEFVVMFPIALVIALVAVNASLFFSECASFDRVFRSAVCTYAASPGYGEGPDACATKVQETLSQTHDASHLTTSVATSGVEGGFVSYKGTLTFKPTLFGSGPLEGAFGISFPELIHVSCMSVLAYKPGVVL